MLVVTVAFLLYLTQDMISYSNGNLINTEKTSNELKIVDSIEIQNNALNNYINSLYNSQVTIIDDKYSKGSISLEEKDKQLNAVIKNRELAINTLNKISNAQKNIFTGNISKQDILIRINSFKDINSDIKTELNATLNGY
ncbi:hypothetical protein [Methanobacterium spitsbergense]|uniref:Uncharacterized protein n=1 Tax=Methanobacterium spitsbergense TaxID=2874285 RepID=A0A8T5V1G2_9EURY|nr:hypothetical protein [Methanobacterium spitsbergense]MBZ2166883.1 hypothetical protein [Methanobacterium spitsbergense]